MRHLTYEHSLDAMTRLLLTLLIAFVPLANADYASCILENMKSVGSDVAAEEIIEACRNKHPSLKALAEKQAKELLAAEQAKERLNELIARSRRQEVAEVSEKVSSYMAMIQRKIMENWSRPSTARNGMEAELEARLLPSGEITSVRIVKGSGSRAFDDSALLAVEKVRKFDLPEDAGLYERKFKRIRLHFRPEDLPL